MGVVVVVVVVVVDVVTGGKQSQLLLKPTEVELGLQVGVEFDKRSKNGIRPKCSHCKKKITIIIHFRDFARDFIFLILHIHPLIYLIN